MTIYCISTVCQATCLILLTQIHKTKSLSLNLPRRRNTEDTQALSPKYMPSDVADQEIALSSALRAQPREGEILVT